jgi:DNA invertase Pin-like site-specific DNA recombinase
MSDARRGRFDVMLVWSFDRVARSVKYFLEVLDELNHLNIALVSFRENIDTGGPLGRAMVVIVGAIAELERSLIVERVKSGMRRARLEGRQIGRSRLDVDRQQVVQDRRCGMSLTLVAKKHSISRASVCRLMKESNSNSSLVVGASGEDVAHEAHL